MRNIEIGQEYLAQPTFSKLLLGDDNAPRQGRCLPGRVIHVNRRAKTVTLEFEVKMGILTETFFVEELGKRVR